MRIRIRIQQLKLMRIHVDPDPKPCFFGGLKYLISLMRIRDPGWRQFRSGMENVGSGIRDKHPGSATLFIRYIKVKTEDLRHFFPQLLFLIAAVPARFLKWKISLGSV
jgi:hypothetical protein